MKTSLQNKKILLHLDYSKNDVNVLQQEIQSVYFGCDTFSIFIACCFLGKNNNNTADDNSTKTSEKSNHSQIAD